jgi:hypothetical protein
LYENENLKRGDRKPKKTSCPYAKMKKIKKGDGRKKNILSLYENENLKKGDGKKSGGLTTPGAPRLNFLWGSYTGVWHRVSKG